jgi:hypothetical protein
VIVLSIPATESYQVTLSDTFFTADRAAVVGLPLSTSTTVSPSSTSTAAPCPTSTDITVLTSIPQEALIQPNISTLCDLWVVAPCSEQLPCEQFVTEVAGFIPSYTMEDFLAWNPDIEVSNDGQICSGFFRNFTYCVGVDQDGGVKRYKSSFQGKIPQERFTFR